MSVLVFVWLVLLTIFCAVLLKLQLLAKYYWGFIKVTKIIKITIAYTINIVYYKHMSESLCVFYLSAVAVFKNDDGENEVLVSKLIGVLKWLRN